MSPSDFLEFRTSEGNKSYVRVDSIAALYHDGRTTRIVLTHTTENQGSLSATEMPHVLFSRLLGYDRR